MNRINMHNLAWLEDPEIFAVNRIAAHSDHDRIDEAGNIIPPFSLNGKWDFLYYEKPDDVDFDVIFDSNHPADFKSVIVPGHIQLQGFGKPQYVNTQYPWDGYEKPIPPQIPKYQNPVGFYIRSFDLPDHFDPENTRISFQGVESCFYVWLNGGFIGYSEDSFTLTEFDLSPFLKKKDNRLCVMVVRFCSGSWMEDQDFWRFSGIFRDVFLYQTAPVHIQDIEIKTHLNDDFSLAQVEANILLLNKNPRDITVSFSLADGKLTKSIQAEALYDEENCSFSMEIKNPKLWNAEEPHLYRADISIRETKSGDFISAARTEIGFRRFEIKNKIMMLNGKRIIFKGINRQEFYSKKGRAIDAGDIEEDLKILKRNNFNAIRTSHYPNNSAFYRLCDRYGFYVIDEANLETHGTWMVLGKVNRTEFIVPDDKPVWEAAVIDRARSMLERDKNHACILMWSCGNESYGGPVIKAMSDWFHQRDSSRLVHYEGISFDRRYDDTSDVESRMYAKPAEIENYLINNPQKPFILCEYAHSMGNSFGNVQKYIDLTEKYPLFQGGFIWDFMDQALLTKDERGNEYFAVGGNFDDHPNDGYFCGDGLLFADRSPSPKLAEAKFLYQPVSITCLPESIRITNHQLFTDTSGYRFEWVLTGDGNPLRSAVFETNIEPGETKEIPLRLDRSLFRGEVILTCSMKQKEATLWAPSDYEVAFGQGILQKYSPIDLDFEEKSPKAHIIDGDYNVGIKMENSFALISKANGKLVSIQSEGAELLRSPISPDFWRAPTDNDLGNGNTFRWAQWKIASLYQKCERVSVDPERAQVTSFFFMPANPKIHCSMEYSFFKKNIVRIRMHLDPVKGDAPCVGIMFKMPGKWNRLSWYGNSQSEAYSDRQSACRIELCEGSVDRQYIPYLHPQECGNKTQLRFFTVTEDRGKGLRLSSDSPFEASALPYTAHEIENASNILHLPPRNETVVGAYKQKCGVGGDDSWGAPVHEEYLIKTDEGIDFTIYLQIL